MKLVVLTNILTPYRIPLFVEMEKKVAELTVLLMAGCEENRRWRLQDFKFRTEILPGFHIKPPGYEVSVHINFGVIRKLRKIGPDIVLNGGFFAPTNIMAFLYCKIFQKKHIGWGEITLRNQREGSVHRKLIRKIMTKMSDSLIASSSEACDSFLYYGAQKQRILTAVMPIDVDWFKKKADEFRQSSECLDLKKTFSPPVLLSVGRMIHYKGYIELFNIYEEVLKFSAGVSLVLVGDGPERRRYEDFVKDKGWNKVYFMGYQQMEELVKFYSISDLFIFPTLYDPFGAVLNEAMACEVPVMSSVYAASTRDLVLDNLNGYIFNPKNCRASAEIVLKFFKLDLLKKREMGKAAYLTVKQFDIQKTADSMVQFMGSFLSCPNR